MGAGNGPGSDIVEYESRLNYTRRTTLTRICTYDLSRRASVAMDILRTHPMVIIGGVLQENPLYVPPDGVSCVNGKSQAWSGIKARRPSNQALSETHRRPCRRSSHSGGRHCRLHAARRGGALDSCRWFGWGAEPSADCGKFGGGCCSRSSTPTSSTSRCTETTTTAVLRLRRLDSLSHRANSNAVGLGCRLCSPGRALHYPDGGLLPVPSPVGLKIFHPIALLLAYQHRGRG